MSMWECPGCYGTLWCICVKKEDDKPTPKTKEELLEERIEALEFTVEKLLHIVTNK